MLSVLLSGCLDISDNDRLEITARALSDAADRCLLDVRDRKLKYDNALNCTALGALSMQYIEAGGFQTDTPAKYALIAEQARATAWTARAVSESGNPGIRIW